MMEKAITEPTTVLVILSSIMAQTMVCTTPTQQIHCMALTMLILLRRDVLVFLGSLTAKTRVCLLLITAVMTKCTTSILNVRALLIMSTMMPIILGLRTTSLVFTILGSIISILTKEKTIITWGLFSRKVP